MYYEKRFLTVVKAFHVVILMSFVAMIFLSSCLEFHIENVPRQTFHTYLNSDKHGAEGNKNIRLQGAKQEVSARNFMKQEVLIKKDTKTEVIMDDITKPEVTMRNNTKMGVDVKNEREPEVAIFISTKPEETRIKNTKTKVSMENNTKSKKAAKNDINNEFIDPGKWTILLTVNNGFYDMFKNWLWHFMKLNITVNITIIAEDDIVFDKLKNNYIMQSVNIVRSWILNESSALFHNTDGYKKMVSTRPAYIIKYLVESVNILFIDIDTVLLKNPFPYFIGDFDMWAQVENNATIICSGFMAFQSNNKTVAVMRQWNADLKETLQLHQPALNQILRKSNLKIYRLSETLFVGEPSFSGMDGKKRSEVVLLHATYCFGHGQKYNCLKKWKLWAFD